MFVDVLEQTNLCKMICFICGQPFTGMPLFEGTPEAETMEYSL